MKRKLIANHANEVRLSRWTLVQLDDRTLHVEQVAQYPNGWIRTRSVPINDVMREGGPPPRSLQRLLDRMFEDD